MSKNSDQQVQSLLHQLKQLASENESLKQSKKSFESSKPESPSSSIPDSQSISLLLALANSKLQSTESISTNLQKNISKKSSHLSFLKTLENKWLGLNKSKNSLNNLLSNLSKASTKQRKLIQNLAYKSSASLYCQNVQKLIETTQAELREKGVNIPETLENIEKQAKLAELKQKIRNLEGELKKLEKKKHKLEQGSDSSLEEFEEKLFSELNNN
jgi:DNA repair exonuclease SbcCD ATPase subunit